MISLSSLSGLTFICDYVPAPVQIAAGKYRYSIGYFADMFHQGAVDVLQADATPAEVLWAS